MARDPTHNTCRFCNKPIKSAKQIQTAAGPMHEDCCEINRLTVAKQIFDGLAHGTHSLPPHPLTGARQ